MFFLTQSFSTLWPYGSERRGGGFQQQRNINDFEGYCVYTWLTLDLCQRQEVSHFSSRKWWVTEFPWEQHKSNVQFHLWPHQCLEALVGICPAKRRWSGWHFGFWQCRIHFVLGTNKFRHHILYENAQLWGRIKTHLEIRHDGSVGTKYNVPDS